MTATMDFFEHQERARKRTGLLVFYFAVAVVLIMLAIYAAVMAVFFFGGGKNPTFGWFNAPVLAGVASFTVILVGFGSLFRIMSLQAGGRRVAEMMGARPVTPSTDDPLERRLHNVVEEMAIASGVPVPPVYVMDQEPGINAFAAGFHPNDAVVCVTRGTLEILNREELQGVVAHEFSHILNGDMRLNIRLMGVLYGILLIGMTGYVIFNVLRFTRTSRSKNNGGGIIIALLLLGLALYAIGYIGVFFGNLIKAAVSREREFLADASAVQFTRNPEGLAGALKQIGASSAGSTVRDSHAREASHMFFESVKRASGPMATHPPLLERIQRLDPQFKGNFSALRREARSGPPPARPAPPPPPRRGPLDSVTGGPLGDVLPGKRVPAARPFDAAVLAAVAADPESVLRSIGAPLAKHTAAARHMLSALPPEIHAAAREPFGARAVLYGLLLDSDQDVAAVQWKRLEQTADHAVLDATRKLAPEVAGIPMEGRLPLVDLSISGLRQLSPPQYTTFRDNLLALAAADQTISLYEFCLLRVVKRALDPPAKGSSASGMSRSTAAATVLSAMALAGQEDAAGAAAAFEQARQGLESHLSGLQFDAKALDELQRVDDALDQLAPLAPKLKRWLVVACLQALVADQQVTIEEAELFRAIAAGLDVPVPMWVAG